MIAADIMNRSAVLLNDSTLSSFTYVAQIPYLNMAIDELQEILEENNVPITNKVSSILSIVVGITTINSTTTPALPTDLIEIQALYERLSGTTDSFLPMERREFLPEITTITSELQYWAWIGEEIKFIGANTNRDVKIEYVASKITAVTSSTNTIAVINSKSFLAYRTAALCAAFIGENPNRSAELNVHAQNAIERMVNISTKSRQAIVTRRRPFMASYKNRGF